MTPIPFDQKSKILREIYRHYVDFKDFYSRTGTHMIEYGPITISFIDLQYGVNELAPRKKEAFFYNVILDMKQKDVADIMGIRTVSVGQYVDQACIQLSDRYFSEDELKKIDDWLHQNKERKLFIDDPQADN